MPATPLRAAVRTIPDFPTPGILFRDITPILGDAHLLQQAVRLLAEPFLDMPVTKVAAMEARGFVLGAMLARQLNAGFIPIRKKGKLPFDTHVEHYSLEYGSDALEMHVDACGPDDTVLVHDDVLATGGTALAARRLLERTGAGIIGYAFLVELAALGGRSALGSEEAASGAFTPVTFTPVTPPIHSVLLY